MTTSTCSIIAGPNGAGKTTFALTYLRESIDCDNFVNADLIAAGLSPLAPAKEAVAAGRLFLAEIERLVKHRESFAFETTLSGRSYLRLISRLKNDDWVFIFGCHRSSIVKNECESAYSAAVQHSR